MTAGLPAIVIPLVVVLRHVADHRAELVERAVGLLDEVGVDARTKNVHVVCETLRNLLRSQLNTKTVSRYYGGGEGVYSLVEYSRLHTAVTVNKGDNSRNARPKRSFLPCDKHTIPTLRTSQGRGEEGGGGGRKRKRRGNCFLSPRTKLYSFTERQFMGPKMFGHTIAQPGRAGPGRRQRYVGDYKKTKQNSGANTNLLGKIAVYGGFDLKVYIHSAFYGIRQTMICKPQI